MKSLVTGANFHDFAQNPVYVGSLGAPVLREKDGTDNQKAGDIMGYNFTDPSGEITIVGASHAITKAVGMVKEGAWLRIEFKGQTQNAKGQKVNVYKIDALDDAEVKALATDGK